MVLPLNRREARQLRRAGTDMEQLPKEAWQGNDPGFGRKYYRFLGDCANLNQETFLCEDYPNRPNVCASRLEAGSEVCGIALGRAMERPDIVQHAEASGRIVNLPIPTYRQR